MRGVGKLSAHQLRLPVTFFPFWLLMNCREEQTFIHHQSIKERKLFWILGFVFEGKGGGFQHETVASADSSLEVLLCHFHLYLHPSSLQSVCVFITTVPCLINDNANVTSNHKTLRAGDNYTAARCDKLCSRWPGREKKSNYVIDIYLDRMKVL